MLARFFLFLLLSLSVVMTEAGTLTKIPINTKNSNPRGYVEYLPNGYDNSGNTKYAVLYWLHGLGHFGAGTSTSLDVILNDQISNWLKTHNVNFIVLAPQDIDGYWPSARIKAFIDWANVAYGHVINPGQQHLAAMSAGGYGLREFIIGNSDTYKAFSTFTFMSTNLNNANGHAQKIIDNNQYVWIHHGTIDTDPNSIEAVKTFHKNVYALDNDRSRLTAYVGLGHSAWDEVYDASGQSQQQLSGNINGTTYYHWTTNDVDKDWFQWMLFYGKSTIPTAPTSISLSSSSIMENNGVGITIGQLSANGTRPVNYRIVATAGRNDETNFSLQSIFLKAETIFDFETRSEYVISIEAFNAVGSFRKDFTVTILDQDNVTSTENEIDRPTLRWNAFPNPFSERISISSRTDDLFIHSVELIHIQGSSVEDIEINQYYGKDEILSLSTNDLAAGIYLVKVRSNRGTEVMKMIKR